MYSSKFDDQRSKLFVISNQQPDPVTSNQQPAIGNKKKWYAVYTKSRNEKKVAGLFAEAGIDFFLPLVRVLKQWSDRKKWVEEPLFRPYLFVHITQEEYFKVLSITGVVRYITFEGKAVEVPQNQIKAIKHYLNQDEDLTQSYEDLAIGDKIEIHKGSLQGLNGNLIEIKGKQKVKIEIESIGQSIYLTISKSYIKLKM